ncbi:type II secretion system protein G [Pseudorhodoferax sp. Leaf265]|nr:type II secretion system protein G [Pseudorhodoferax sp. Leaf265]
MRSRPRGFTLIELLVVLAVVATLLALVAPQYFGSVDRAKEVVLKENLATLRTTIDKFYADSGRYPETLQELVDRRYLRHVPEDPVSQTSDAWVIVPPPQGEKGSVFDIRSASAGVGRNGKAFAEW